MTDKISIDRSTLEQMIDIIDLSDATAISNAWAVRQAIRTSIDQADRLSAHESELMMNDASYCRKFQQGSIAIKGDGILLQEEDELGWIDVPCDWSRTCPPTSARRFGCVEVMFVDGDTRMGHPNHWQMEWNCNSTYHILKYRDANSK